jgi:lysyl-tRNA synthetase class 2
MTAADWRPAASLSVLELRAQLLASIRQYFAQQEVMEVETPVLAAAGVTEVQLASLQTTLAGRGRYFLQTSPEYAMKRLLAAGAPDIYQVSRVFRDNERGAHHNPEFTLVEWYRHGFDAAALMEDGARLLARLLPGQRPVERLTYSEAMQRHAGVDPLAATPAQLQAALERHGVSLGENTELDRDARLDLLMSAIVGPQLGRGHLTFIHQYPASQAALARLNPADPRVAQRFEIYVEGIELANGFHELANAAEQRRRFARDAHERHDRGLPSVPADERLLAALEHGLPECSGVALGFDRVVMLAAGARSLQEVMAFPIERA